MKRRSSRTPLTQQPWDGNRWRHRCAWCEKKIPERHEVFTISVRLHPAAYEEIAPGEIAPLLLPSLERVIPMMVVEEGSQAKLDGKDAMFQLCSETCAQALQATLRRELPA